MDAHDIRVVRKTGLGLIWLFFLFVVILSVGWFIFTMLSRPAALVDRVTDPDRIIANYEWFEEAYNDCLALDAKIATTAQQIESQFKDLPKDRSGWSRQDRDAWNQWQTTLNGQRSQRQNIVAEYNAKSKLITRQLWKSPNLPYQLEIIDDETRGAE